MQTSGKRRAAKLAAQRRGAGAPSRALAPLESVRSRATLLDPTWFVDPTNFKAATNDALDAREQRFRERGRRVDARLRRSRGRRHGAPVALARGFAVASRVRRRAGLGVSQRREQRVCGSVVRHSLFPAEEST